MNFKLTISIILLYCVTILKAQPCNSPNVSLINQEDIQGFLTQNGSCTEIIGNLVIGVGMQNLDGLENIEKIGGYLSMSNCDNLQNIKGLSNLEEIVSYARIQHNPQLKSLAGLDKLSKVSGEFFYISDNDLINELTPLSNLDSIKGIFQIWDMDNLTDMSGLSSLKMVTNDLSIFRNINMTSIKGMDSLISINGALRIYENQHLNSIVDFNSTLVVDGQVFIYDNPVLSICNAVVICNKLATSPDEIIINENDIGCNNKQELIGACLTHVSGVEKDKLRVSPNPFIDIIIIESDNRILEIRIIDVFGREVLKSKSNSTIDLSNLKSGIYYIKSLSDVKTMLKL